MNRLRCNASGYVNEFRFFLSAFLIAATLDLITTMHFMLKDGTETELHPAIRFVAWILGPIWGPILGKLCQFLAALVVTIHLRSYARIILVVATFLYTWAAWYNVWGKNIYVPRLMEYFPG